MQSLQCVLVIVNIFFVISYEGVKATLLEKGRPCNHSEDNNNVIHEIVEEVASSINNKYFKGSHDDKKNEVSVIGSLLNALVRNEQEKAEKKNSKVKEKEINDGHKQLFIFDTKSGRLIGRTGIRIENFLNHMREKFEGSVVIQNTMFKPYSSQKPGGSGNKTSGQDPYAPKTSQGGAGSWKTSGQDPYSPKGPQGGSGGCQTSGHNPYSPQKPQAGAGGSKTLSHDPFPKSPQGGSGGWKTSGHNLISWKSSGHDPYSPHGPLHNDYGWESLGEGEKEYYESSLIIDGGKQ